MEGLADISRSAHDAFVELLLDRHRFAGQGCLIENGQPFDNCPVDRDHVPFADDEAIARFDRVQTDLFKPAVFVAHRATRYAGEKSRHFTACTTLGEALEVLSARVHQRDHDGGEVFGKDERSEHRERGHDVQPHVAAAQTENDLHHESDQDRDSSRGPNRTCPRRLSEKMRQKAEHQANRRQCDDNRSKMFAKICDRPSAFHRP
jgi:hypothetical protein